MRRLLSVTILAVACAAIGFGQEFRATLNGDVTDPQGAMIPAVKITATHKETGARFETVSGAGGQYTLPFLTPGLYSLTAESDGFKRYVQDNVQISTNQRVTVNIKMEVGAMVESVTVNADAPMLVTSTASVGQAISTRQIENMPMNGRTPLVLAQLAFGVVPTGNPNFTRPFDNAGPSDFSMGGGQGRSNELLLDGSPDMTRDRRVAYNPPVDTVQEIKVETFQADAAYGNTAGGTVNVVMKGGTNELHGTAYEFNQVSRLAGTPFFTNASNNRKPVTRFNQWGVTAGAPLWIPKVINGRNRVFWYFAYEGIKNSSPEPITTTVPTEAMRNGNFSELLRLGPIYQLYDPFSAVAEGARRRRQPIPGNLLPANRISPIARNFMQFFPLPNQQGRDNTQDNYLANTVRSDDFFSFMGRIDVNISDKHKMFWNMRNNDRIENRGNRFNNIASGNFLSRVNYGSTVDDVYSFNPTTILNTRLNWTRFIESNNRPSEGFNFVQLGFPSALGAASSQNVLPLIDFSDPTNDLGASGGSNTPFDSYQIFSALTKIAGRHTLKMGADIRRQQESSIGHGNSAGSYVFNNNWVRGPLDSNAGSPTGMSLASFLLGLPTGGNFDRNAFRTNKADYMAYFIQDDWRINSRLTFNLGLRFEKEFGTTERFDRTLAGYDFTSSNRITAAARAAYAAIFARTPIPELPVSQFNPVGGPIFAGPNRRNIYSTDNRLLSPRFGVAWSPEVLGPRTVIRTGYGIFFATYGTTGVSQPGFSQRTDVVSTLDGNLTPFATLANPFPTGLLSPAGNSEGINTFLGQSIGFTNPTPGQPYTQRWSFSIQREIGSNMVFEIGYVGSRSLHINNNQSLNFFPASLLSTSPTRDQAAIDRLTANVANPFQNLLPGTALNGSTIRIEQITRPFAQMNGEGGVSIGGLNEGWADFHMFQVRLEKRLSNGLQFLANYSRSRMMEATGRLNAQDLFMHKTVANEDRPQRFVFSTSYDLPFGRGKAIAGGAGMWANRLIGGWVINGIYTNQTHGALSWGNVIYLGGDINLNPRAVDGAFDTSRFVTAPALQMDRNLRTFPQRFSNLRQDRINNLDLSLIKNTAITERVNLQFRAEAFNSTNRAQFNGPSLGAAAANFGRITGQANLPRQIQLALRLVW